MTVLKVLKKPTNLKNTRVDVQVKLRHKNGCLPLKNYTSELLNLSVGTMNSIVEDIIKTYYKRSQICRRHTEVFL